MTLSVPSAKPWTAWTYASLGMGWYNENSLHVMDNGEVWVTASVDVPLRTSADDWPQDTQVLGKITPEGFQRVGGDMMAHPYYRGLDVSETVGMEGYAPRIAITTRDFGLEASVFNDGEYIWYRDPQRRLFRFNPGTYQADLILGSLGNVPSVNWDPPDEPVGANALLGHDFHIVKVGNHLYWRYLVLTGPPYYRRKIRRMSLDPPYGVEEVSDFDESPSWWSAFGDDNNIDPATNLPYSISQSTSSIIGGTTIQSGLAHYDGYLYFVDGNAGSGVGASALKRWPITGGPTELLYYAFGESATGDYPNYDTLSTVTGLDEDGPGASMSEGFTSHEGPFRVMDGWLYMINEANESQSFSTGRWSQGIIRFDLDALLEEVAANGPVAHNGEDPFYETICNTTAPWEDSGRWNENVRDREYNWRDGEVPIVGGIMSFDVSPHDDWAGRVVVLNSQLSYLAPYRYTNMVTVLEPPDHRSRPSFDVSLQFEGSRFQGYQRQVQVDRFTVPEKVVLS